MLSFIFAPESASKARFYFVVLLSRAISANRSESLNFAFFAKSEWGRASASRKLQMQSCLQSLLQEAFSTGIPAKVPGVI